MSMPFYVSPEQLMSDRAEFARKGIARGRSAVVASCCEGIALIADNPSRSLRKVSEIHDRIGFAAVGRYNEFESLRVAGIQQADLRGYAYDRADVTARALAGQYSQLLGGAFASGAAKPYEVELVVCQVTLEPATDMLFHINYDGTIQERRDVVALGGDAEGVVAAVMNSHELPTVQQAVRAARHAFADAASSLEVAVLERHSSRRRRFRRVSTEEVNEWLA